MKRALKLHPTDNVAVVVNECLGPEKIEVSSPQPESSFVMESLEGIPFGHKIALHDLSMGEMIIKYGRPIGRATANIAKGSLVGVHNIEGLRGRGDLNAQGE